MKRPCSRPGCPVLTAHQQNADGERFCSHQCKWLTVSLAEAERVIAAIGPTELGSRWQSALTQASDSWSNALKFRQAMEDAALSVGISPAAWHEIRLGGVRPRTRRKPRDTSEASGSPVPTAATA